MNRTLTVGQLNDYIAGVMTHDPILRNLNLRGEVSNLRITSSGHGYFALKDEDASISCVCFARALGELRFPPQNGDHVTAYGYVSIYTRSGQLQFYVQDMEREGLGLLFERFEKRKAELQEKGYFDQERKRSIPAYPRRIGIVTSATGAVLHDIRNVSWRRNPGQRLLLCPAKVQGEGAAGEIARGIRMLNALEDVDVVIVGRGGGSMEDLWPFNELEVAEAIYQSEKPVISAVGHETDFTIADFVADLRAPTPSAAAELAVPSVAQSMLECDAIGSALRRGIEAQMHARRMALTLTANSSGMRKVGRRIDEEWQRLDQTEYALRKDAAEGQRNREQALDFWSARLTLAGPDSMLKRGYALVHRKEGKPVHSAGELNAGDEIVLRFADGAKQARVGDWDGKK